jgi:hypothetical protein
MLVKTETMYKNYNDDDDDDKNDEYITPNYIQNVFSKVVREDIVLILFSSC